jgi:hypothetical protein
MSYAVTPGLLVLLVVGCFATLGVAGYEVAKVVMGGL